ncbi:2-phosphosulfolactate phosphatase [Pedobacter sp. UYP30]|uniref:2-phosphosulfolactate phosphatase n=1 Tax=Pedobacter sp. UYP30 TaxID=1756400 RepID=UPI00339861A3
MPKKIEVCLTPALIDLHDIEESTVVVIDILRASSSITVGIDNGAAAIIPVAMVEECLAYADRGFLLAAERNGEVVEGYDFGNSPFSYTEEKVAGKTIVLTTTNGTGALQLAAARAKQVLIGSFLNLQPLCNYLESLHGNVLLLCAGWKNQFNLEDTLFAGAVVNALRKNGTIYDDASIAAQDLYLIAKNDLRGYLKKSSHSYRLAALDIEDDVVFCLQQNICEAIPVLEGEKLVRLIVND